MTYTIDWLEKKSPDWTILQLHEGATPYKDVSVNRVGKTGDVFPGFDDMAPGREVDGTIWKSPKNGKYYLFPPKEGEASIKGPGGYRKMPSNIDKAMDRKEDSIEKSQDRKEEGIKISAAQRDAVLVVTQIMTFNPNENVWGEEDIKEMITKWRNWFLLSKEFNDLPPFE